MSAPHRAPGATAFFAGAAALIALLGVGASQSWLCAWLFWLAFGVLALITVAAGGLTAWNLGVEHRGWPWFATYAEKQERREREETERAAEQRAIEEFNYALSQIKSELLTHRERLHKEITARSYRQNVYYRDAYIKYRRWLAYAEEETDDGVRNAHDALTDLTLRGQERNRTASNESDFRDARWLRLSDDELHVRIAARDTIDDAVARLTDERREWQESAPLTRRAQVLAFVRGLGRGGRAS